LDTDSFLAPLDIQVAAAMVLQPGSFANAKLQDVAILQLYGICSQLTYAEFGTLQVAQAFHLRSLWKNWEAWKERNHVCIC